MTNSYSGCDEQSDIDGKDSRDQALSELQKLQRRVQEYVGSIRATDPAKAQRMAHAMEQWVKSKAELNELLDQHFHSTQLREFGTID